MEQLKSSSPRTRRTRQQVTALLSEFDNGGLSVNDFCLLHHINRSAFYKWQLRYKGKRVQKHRQPAFAEVKASLFRGDALFAEVNNIRIYQAVTASFLKELLP